MKPVFIQTPGRRLVPALVLAAAAVALTGCVVAPAYPVGPSGEVVYAPMAPPPVQTEVIPVAPSPVHVWIGGSWGWGGGRYAWRPHRWDHGPRGWYQRPGGWYRR